MSKAAEKFSAWVLKNRSLTLFLIGFWTLVMAAATLRLQIVTDFEAFFLPGDPDLGTYNQLKASFGSDEFIIVAYEAKESVFDVEPLEELSAITRQLEGLVKQDQLAQVISLANAKEFRASEKGLPLSVPILPPPPLSNLVVFGVQAKIQANPFYRDFLVSKDGKTAFLLVQMSNPRNENSVRINATDAVESVVAPFDKGNIRMAGSPIYLTELYRMIVGNLVWLGGSAFLIVVLLLWLSTRSLLGVLLPMCIMSLSVLWNMGIFGLAGAPITIASSVVVPVIIAISVTGSIYFLLAYEALLKESRTPEEALREAMGHIVTPGFFATLTTSFGFLTLVTAEIKPVVQTGLYTAGGVAASFLLTVTLVPIALSYFPHAAIRGGKAGAANQGEESGVLIRILDRITQINLKHPVPLTIAWGILGLASLAGMALIRVETNPLTFFSPDTPIAKTHRYFENHLGGTLPFDLVVEGEKGDFKRLDAYPNLARLQKFLDGLPELHGVVGTPDVLKEINAAMTNGARTLPYEPQEFQDQARLAELARKYYPLIGRFITEDWSQARFTGRIQGMSSKDLAWLIRKIDSYAKDNLDGRFRYRVTGIVKLLANMIEKIRDSQTTSFGTATVLLWLCFLILLRSPLLATLAMIPNLIPVLLTLGFMGIAGIELDLATVMMPSIAVGIAVDDTFHFYSAFLERLRLGDTPEEAIRWTVHFRGRAFIYTAVVLIAGFGILLLSNLRPVADFGVISAVAIGSALVCELFLSPALLRLAGSAVARKMGRA
ncbi:MAG: MMPL family transporter [Bdellovibrionota bacterium]